ncbi:hypothetical protein CFP65_6535 [Kitasatospora sp. MMS16-BH015]|uniref:hypothetical protein n=1 Tax=Kitasatospora sp. MMS16-BH015 TaxID=2018025 RepID=UPI000CA3B66A|nr:hypothetical protein [Kitasatospora sp. MMS16-BH015]AUG81185.1 hypothetical protein CFP65_6535 [Kitasatospora sp. MMS16-BH015]
MVTHPLHIATDLAHGGRWTSLRAAGREWLWHRPDPARAGVRPGDAFVDAGGLEECLPTVRGLPDHGDAWSRPWHRSGEDDLLVTPDYTLRRRIAHNSPTTTVSYELRATPGYRFLWAAHALLDLSPAARLLAPAGTPTRLFPEAAELLAAPWPPGARYRTGPWPAPCGLPLERLGPADGTAVGAILTDCPSVTVQDGADQLTLTLRAEAGTPCSVALWRNLGGFPATAPYRSIGVEPMLGRVFDLAEVEAGAEDTGPDAATVPASGVLRWELDLTATSHPDQEGPPA